MAGKFRDYTMLGITQSLCPECLAVVPAKIITRGNRVYFRKKCLEHGEREDFVCSDVSYYDQSRFNVPAKLPREYGVLPDKGCPLDCGLCTEHEQHTCIGLLEITSSCNLACPMCYASSGPGGKHLSLEQCQAAIDRYVQVEGNPEVMQISGGEPTIHPQFYEILDYALAQPIDYLMINTNGIRLANDRELLEKLASHQNRLEIYLQFDGFSDSTSLALRGEALVETKLRAVERCGEVGLHVNLVCTLQPGVNDHEMGEIIRFCETRHWITGVSFQPATYSGRHVLPEVLERRITFPDVIRGIAEQTKAFQERDFIPLPCAHPNCHQMSYAYRQGDKLVPLMRFIDATENLDLLAGGISFKRPAVKEIIDRYLLRHGCCPGGSCVPEENGTADSLFPIIEDTGPPFDLAQVIAQAGPEVASAAVEFFEKATREQLGATDVFRVMITSFLDAYNFDVRRVMKCCVHHLLPSGHIIPFCAYNVLYREGHVPLPELTAAGQLTKT